MSETPHLRPSEDGEVPPETRYSPRRLRLTPESWENVNHLLRESTRRVGGNVIGDEILQFGSGMHERAYGMARIVDGVLGSDRIYSGMTVSVDELFPSGSSEGIPTISFPGTLDPSDIARRTGLAMTQANIILAAVESPLRFPEQ